MKQLGTIVLTLMITIFLTNISCSSEQGDTGEKVMLKFHPEEGREYLTSMQVTSETKMMGIKIPFEIRVNYTIFPTEVNDSVSVVQVTYNDIYLKSENPMTGAMEYKSDSPAVAKGMGAEKVKEIYGGIVGKTFTARFNKNGKVIKTGDVSTQMGQGLGTMGTTSDMQQYLETMIATFPDKPVGKGDTWNKIISDEGNKGMRVESKYTVTKVTKNTVELEIEGEVLPSVTDTAGSTISVSGDLTGELVVDRNTGWTQDGTIIQNLNMEAKQGMQTMKGTAENKIMISTK